MKYLRAFRYVLIPLIPLIGLPLLGCGVWMIFEGSSLSIRG
jgi:hypothetical protein